MLANQIVKAKWYTEKIDYLLKCAIMLTRIGTVGATHDSPTRSDCTLKYISADDEIRAIADLRQKNINDYNSEMTVALETGREEGIAIKARETALTLLSKGDARC